MEILDSAKSLEDIHGFLFNMAHYVLEGDITFRTAKPAAPPQRRK